MVKMKLKYSRIDNNYNCFEGYSLDNDYLNSISVDVRNYLIDKPEIDKHKNELEQLLRETGFTPNKNLLVDIQSLDQIKIEELKEWEIGEAIAHIFLKNKKGVRFYWNVKRDLKNPKAIPTGADLVGFIEIDGNVLFLFGEVKTSRENRQPPQIMLTTPDSMNNQLISLIRDEYKRKSLIQYLANKTRNLADSDSFKQDYNIALKTYYNAEVPYNYQLIGILVRYNVSPDKNDLKDTYTQIKNQIDKAGIKLLALYLEISMDNFIEFLREN